MDLLDTLPRLAPGSVWLVGAGPGDPGLLSAYGLAALGQADVIVHDALVDARILDLAPATAVREHAGKRGGRPSPTQPDISASLIAYAHANKRVLRLKGGDPFVFGRGAEEALALRAAGVPFRIVPGVTAGLGGLAYAGIPVTHRGASSAVALVTGHSADGEVVDWPALARMPTVVFYMALARLDHICAQLIAHGRAGGTPAALVCHATTPAQAVVETTLGGAVDAARDATAPALFVVGDVVALRRDLNWVGDADG